MADALFVESLVIILASVCGVAFLTRAGLPAVLGYLLAEQSSTRGATRSPRSLRAHGQSSGHRVPPFADLAFAKTFIAEPGGRPVRPERERTGRFPRLRCLGYRLMTN